MFWDYGKPVHRLGRIAFFCATAVCATAASDNNNTKTPIETADARVSISTRELRAPDIRSSISVDVNVVMVPVTVTDAMERPQLNLKTGAFHLYEDGVEQRIEYFAAEQAPLSLGIVFDSSGSMKAKIGAAREAVKRILQMSVPGDEYFVIDFSSEPRLLTNFTGSADAVEAAVAGIRPDGWTSLIDAVYLAVNQMKRAGNSRKALFVLSDGADNHSRYRQGELRNLLRESDVALYSVGILGQGIGKKDMKLLASFADDTGGRLFTADGIAELPEAIDNVNTAMRQQYVLGYRSTNPVKDGKFRRIQVKLNEEPQSPPLHASWRTGYYAPY